MNKFCNKFFSELGHEVKDCLVCGPTWEKILEEEKIDVEQVISRTDMEKDGLDCHGRP